MKDIQKLIEPLKFQISVMGGDEESGIPVVCVKGCSLPEAWEHSLLGLYAYGAEMLTEYDSTDAGKDDRHPPSRDCTMVMTAEKPLSDPFIHKAFPGGLEDLEEYRQEVLEGVKDHWVRNHSDPSDKRWEYTYHERLFNFRGKDEEKGADQVEQIISRLADTPHSRRAQAVTWQPWKDAGIEDPPCLQSIWLRVSRGAGGAELLNMNVRFRSRDAYDAAFMNCFALVLLQEKIAVELSRRIGREITPGRYVDISDSYHIYGRRLEDFEERFLSQVKKRKFEERTWPRAFAEEIFTEARKKIKRKISSQDEKYKNP